MQPILPSNKHWFVHINCITLYFFLCKSNYLVENLNWINQTRLQDNPQSNCKLTTEGSQETTRSIDPKEEIDRDTSQLVPTNKWSLI